MENGTQTEKRGSKRLIVRLLVVAVLMFGFGFALVPLYDIFCEVTGLRIVDKGRTDRGEYTGGVVTDRLVTVTFDANTNSQLPWSFGPTETSIEVHPGEAVKTLFTATNKADYSIVGNAVPSIVPSIGNKYFAKTECFCFTEQVLEAGETREMPVLFIIDPELPADVDTLTLSYTFYKNDEATERVARHGDSLDVAATN